MAYKSLILFLSVCSISCETYYTNDRASEKVKYEDTKYEKYDPTRYDGKHEDKKLWRSLAYEELRETFQTDVNMKVARNVILFVGDGMDPNTVTAARIFKESEIGRLSFEKFPNIGLLKTYSVNKKVPDSGASATALFTGVKTNNDVISVDANVKLDDCEASLKEEVRVPSIMQWAQESGKDTGFVTNTRVTDATPAALYSHSASRYWECDNQLPEYSTCKDIARQLVEDDPGRNFKVILGGGRQCLTSYPESTPSDRLDIFACSRNDRKDLIFDWKSDKNGRRSKYHYVTNTEELISLDYNHADYILGLFKNSHLPFEDDRNTSIKGTPSLEVMTEAALRLLKKNRNGFVLMVEAGLIDEAHHEGQARIALEETLELDKAVKKTMELLQNYGLINDTLVIVTGDHGHTMSINGYPDRKENILGMAQKSKHNDVPYTILSYATGKIGNFDVDENGNRRDPTRMDTTAREYQQQAAIITDRETHGGGDVPVYARGPHSFLFHGVHEESYVAHVIAYSMRIGPFRGSAIVSLPSLYIFPLFVTILLLA